MELKRIEVLLKNDEKTRVWAACDGNLAVHKTIVGMRINYPSPHDMWTITHIPTGLVVAPDCSHICKDKVPDRLARVKAMTWHNIAVVDMPACEVLQNMDYIVSDLFDGTPVREGWKRDTLPRAMQQARCT